MANTNTQPIYPDTPRHEQVSLAVANTARDGSGTITNLFTAGTKGSKVTKVRGIHAGAIGAASTAMVIRFWKVRSSTSRLLLEKALSAVTPSASVIAADTGDVVVDWDIPSGDSIGVTVSVSEAVHFTAQGGDF